jgi:serine/threonine protein kinase
LRNHLRPKGSLQLVFFLNAVEVADRYCSILVTTHDATTVVTVIDFGVAKALGQALTDNTVFTGFAQMIGTPPYMSPEQDPARPTPVAGKWGGPGVMPKLPWIRRRSPGD